MNRRTCVLIGFVALGVACQAAVAAKKVRPNIVLVMADDLNWNDLGCYGNKDIKTPNMDQLAREGLRFTHCFTATAMCSPTRQQLYTGVFPVRNGAYPNHSKVKPSARSLVHHFKPLGYRVGLVGKRHFGPPASFPFETVNNKTAKEFISREGPFLLVVASGFPHTPWPEPGLRTNVF